MSAVTVSRYGADLGDQLGAVKPHVAAAAAAISEALGITTMSGYRSGNSVDLTGHPAGLAIDIPAGKSAGDAVAGYVTANAAALGVKYVIWQQRIWKPGGTWQAMATRAGDRPGYDPNHLRHVHVSFTEAAPDAGLLAGLRSGAASAVSAVTGAVATLNPLDGWDAKATALGIKIVFVLAGVSLLVVGAQRLVAPAVMSTIDKAVEAVT